MTRQEIARALGGTVSGKWINIRGPGHSRLDRSLGIRFDANARDGFFIKSFAHDDPIKCREHVQAMLRAVHEGSSLAIEPDASLSVDRVREARRMAAIEMWSQAKPAKGTIVEVYLASRHCELSATVSALRFHPRCCFGTLRFPAMVGLMTHIITDEPLGIHRTALKDDGAGKRPMPEGMSAKMMLGVAKHAVVKLAAPASHLGIAEGIETALSAQKIFDIPVWAALSAACITALPVIDGLKKLTIFADHDEAGLSAARRCGGRYAKAGIEVEVRYPPEVNTDWNCCLLKRRD